MKIGLVSPYDYSYPGGVTVHINNLSKDLINLGHTVDGHFMTSLGVLLVTYIV